MMGVNFFETIFPLLLLGAPSAESCDQGAAEVERIIDQTTLTSRSITAFVSVAKTRAKKGQDVLPGLIGCPSISAAADELIRNPATKRDLRRQQITAKDYLAVGWAIVVASDPSAFVRKGAINSKLEDHNRAVYAQHRKALASLLDPK